ncbi:hypothetical protein E2C01_044098 [Portunus trituberculatus]|uniref:Uncharacterized protein n=1 Tax=Portunus trituberculatus TaxID=210409 RepID=A0A5B7FXG9_PORTR|nr:hypothetical protein [Portunus trituberculatus]
MTVIPIGKSYGDHKLTTGMAYFKDDYLDIIWSTHKKFRVMRMQKEEFYNLNFLVKAVTKHKASQGKFSKSYPIVVKDRYKEGFLLKDHYSGIDEDTFKVRLQPGRKFYALGNSHLENVNIIHKYNQERLLKKSKVDQLKSLLPFYPNPNKRAWLEGLGSVAHVCCHHDTRVKGVHEALYKLVPLRSLCLCRKGVHKVFDGVAWLVLHLHKPVQTSRGMCSLPTVRSSISGTTGMVHPSSTRVWVSWPMVTSGSHHTVCQHHHSKKNSQIRYPLMSSQRAQCREQG